jgi:hypothetical protein
VDATPGGDWLLAGDVTVEVEGGGSARLALPPGAPGRPPTDAELSAKVRDCAGERADAVLAVDWDEAAALLP